MTRREQSLTCPDVHTFKDSFGAFLGVFLETDSFVELAQQLSSFARYTSAFFSALPPIECNKLAQSPTIKTLCEERHAEYPEKLFELPQRWLNFFLAFEKVRAPVELWRGILDSLKQIRPVLLDLPPELSGRIPATETEQAYTKSRMGERLRSLGLLGWWAIPTPVLNHFLAVFNVIPISDDIDLEPIIMRVKNTIFGDEHTSPDFERAAMIVKSFDLYSVLELEDLQEIGRGLVQNDQVQELNKFLQGGSAELAKWTLNLLDVSTHKDILHSLMRKFQIELKEIPKAYSNTAFLALRIYINEEGWMKAEERFLGLQCTCLDHTNPDSGMRFLVYVLLRMRKVDEAGSVCSRHKIPTHEFNRMNFNFMNTVMKQNFLLMEEPFGLSPATQPSHDAGKFLTCNDVGIQRSDVLFLGSLDQTFSSAVEKIKSAQTVVICSQEYGDIADFNFNKIAVMQMAVPGFVAIFDFITLKHCEEFFTFFKELLEDKTKKVGFYGNKEFENSLRCLDLSGAINIMKKLKLTKAEFHRGVLRTFDKAFEATNTTSCWKRRPLRGSQIHDAALKATVLLTLMQQQIPTSVKPIEVLVQNKELLQEYMDERGKPRILVDESLSSTVSMLNQSGLDTEAFNIASDTLDGIISVGREHKRVIITCSRELFDRPHNVPMLLVQDEETLALKDEILKHLGVSEISDLSPLGAPKKVMSSQSNQMVASTTGTRGRRRGEQNTPDLQKERTEFFAALEDSLRAVIMQPKAGTTDKALERLSFFCNKLFWKQEYQLFSAEFEKTVMDVCNKAFDELSDNTDQFPAGWCRFFSFTGKTTSHFRAAVVKSVRKYLSGLKTQQPERLEVFKQTMKQEGLKSWLDISADFLPDFVDIFRLGQLEPEEKQTVKETLSEMLSNSSKGFSERLPLYIKAFGMHELLTKEKITAILLNYIETDRIEEYLSFLPEDVEIARKTGVQLDPHSHKPALRELRKRFNLTVRDFPKSFMIHCIQFVKHMVKDKGWMIMEEKFCTAETTSKDPNNPDSGMRFLVNCLAKQKSTRGAALSICKRHKFKLEQFKKLKGMDDVADVPANILFECDEFGPSSVQVHGHKLEDYLTLKDFNIKEQDVIMVDKVDHVFHRTCQLFLSAPCVGVDGEFCSDTYGVNHPTIATLQIATEKVVAIYDFVKLGQAPELYEFCKKLFADPKIEIVGHTFHSDIGVLRASFREDQPLEFNNIINIEQLIRVDGKGVGLAKLVTKIFEKEFCKVNQCSNWKKRPLRKAQIHYGALDAVATLHLLLKVRKEPTRLQKLNGEHLMVLNLKGLMSNKSTEMPRKFILDKSLADLSYELAKKNLEVACLYSNSTLSDALQLAERLNGVFLTTNPFALSLTSSVPIIKFSVDNLATQLKQLSKYVRLESNETEFVPVEETEEPNDSQKEPSEDGDEDETSQGANVEEEMLA